MKSDRLGDGRVEEEKTMCVALIGGKRRIVESPIGKIIVGAVTVPLRRRNVKCDLHPMPLRLVITILRRSRFSRVRPQGDKNSE